MDNIEKRECQNDVINLLQEKEYNEDGVRMFFRNFVNIEVEEQLKDEVNKYKEKQKRRIIDVYNAFNEDTPNEIKKIKMVERLPFRTALKDYERYFKIQCILSKLLYNGTHDFNVYKVIPYNNLKYEVPKDYKKTYIKADQYVEYKGIYIPIIDIKGLSSKCIYIVNKNKMGKMQKNERSFKIEINDFYNNDKLIEKFMTEKVNGLDISGQERKNHLLESVNIFIQEYVKFDEDDIECYKFINNKVID